MDELVTVVTGGVPVNTIATGVDLERALQNGSHRNATENLLAIWKKMGEDVRRQKYLLIQKSAAHEVPYLRVSPWAAVVTG